MAYTGSLSAILFLLFPGGLYTLKPVLAAGLTIVGNAAYATSIVCANAFLPGLAREDEGVMALAKEDGFERTREEEEEQQLLPSRGALSESTEVESPPASRYASLLSLTISRLSSTGTALGFLSGVSVLVLLVIPVTLLHGSTASLCLAIGLSGVWWAVFTIPAWVGLPSGSRHPGQGGGRARWMSKGWARVGSMLRWSEMKALPNLYTFLLAWIFLSDGGALLNSLIPQADETHSGFHTTTYTAILYASSTLRMSAPKIILIGILVQLSAVFSSILAPRLQRRLGYSNIRLLVRIVLAAQVLPLYTCLGLLLPFGGLRTEGEMYVAATWFGMVRNPSLPLLAGMC